MKQLSLPITAPVSRQVSQERLPTNTTTRHHSVHRWFNFIAGFSPEFVSNCILDQPPARRRVLLDPFTGCGTAQVEGLRHNMKVIGFEPHPTFFRIARAKTNASAKELFGIEAVIAQGFRNPCDPKRLGEKPSEFLNKLFSQDILAQLVGARIAVQEGRYAESDLAFLVLSKVLDNASHSQTDGIYKAPTSSKRSHDTTAALAAIIGMITEDIAASGKKKALSCQLINASSEDMSAVPSGTIDIVVTSPPYLNNFDYAEMTRMYLYFWGVASTWGEISDRVRAKLIVNTTTALKGHKDKQDGYRASLPTSLQDSLSPIVAKLRDARKIKAGKKEYDFLVYPYFCQMQSVLQECRRVMKPNARFHMMVADAALYGTHIPAPQLLADLLRGHGFVDVSCEQVRKRGHRWILDKREGSTVGLGEYHIAATRSK